MLGRKGYRATSVREFKKNFRDRHWLSFTKDAQILINGKFSGFKKEKIRVDTYLEDDEYYKFCVFCIRYEKSRGEFIKTAIKEKMERIMQEKKVQKNAMKNGSLV